MHGLLHGDALERAVQAGNAPFLHIVHEHVEGGFVELDHVDAERL